MSEAIDLTKFCYAFPDLKEPNISRDIYLNSVKEIYGKNINIIIITGEEEVGKTTFLAQFAKKNSSQAISAFINFTSYYSCDEQLLLKNFCNQVYFLLKGKELADETEINTSFLGKLIHSLDKYSRSKKKIYFIIDGLEDILEVSEEKRKSIFRLIPLENQNFCFLISGNEEVVRYLEDRKVSNIKSQKILPFTLLETKIYLQKWNIPSKDIEEIYEITSGYPGRLACIGRLLSNPKINRENLLEKILNETNLLELEWKNVDLNNENSTKLIALISYEAKKHSKEEIMKILEIDDKALTTMTSDLSFLKVDSEKNEIFFVSEVYRKFAEKKLIHLKDKIIEMKIKYWTENLDKKGALNYLPDYLMASKDQAHHETLLKYLSPENFIKILECNKSLYPLKEKMKMGLNTAIDLEKVSDIFRFSINNSILSEMDRVRTERAELSARMILEGYEAAVNLAQNSLLKEDRLHLLAIIARLKQEEGLTLEQKLLDQIRDLYKQINPIDLEERYMDIATDLIYSHVDLALDLIEKVTNTKAEPNALDMAYAKLAMDAMALKEEEINSSDFIDSVRNKIKNPGLKKFSSDIKFLFDDYNEKEILNQVKKLNNPNEKIFLLRLWVAVNREREYAFEVVEYALNVLIRSSAYAPKTADMKDMAVPLPFIKDIDKLKELIKEFDVQQEHFKKIGPAEEYVRWQLILFRAEINYDFEKAYERLIKLLKHIFSFDTIIKASTLALMASEIAKLLSDSPENIDKVKLQSDLEKFKISLNAEINKLLGDAGEHYEVTKNIIKSLSIYLPDTAIELVLKLNTVDRRERAFFELVSYSMNVPTKNINLKFIKKIIKEIIDFDLKEQALLKVIKRLGTSNVNIEHMIDEAMPLIFLIPEAKSCVEKCIALCYGHNFLKKYNKNGKFEKKLSKIIDELDMAWEKIDREWIKVDIGFKIAYLLAKYNREKGLEYLKKATDLRNSILLSTNTCANVYIGSILLALRAYKGLLPQKLISEKDFEYLEKYIDKISSNSRKAMLWADIALYNYLSDDKNKCETIVSQKVKPLLEKIEGEKCKIYTTTKVAPALFYSHKETAYDIISELPLFDKELAYGEICKFIIRKQLSSEPFDSLHKYSYKLTYEEIRDICELLSRIQTDSVIYHFTELIADYAHKRDALTTPQRNKVISLWEELIKEKLPDKRNIKHDGYIIAMKIQVARISNSNSKVWSDLKNEIDKIPNLADKAFLLTKMVTAMSPAIYREKRKDILEELETLLKIVPSIYDKLIIYESLASVFSIKETDLAKKFMKMAIEAIDAKELPEIGKIQRNIIDIAYNLDEKFAESLTAMVNDDPARIKTAKLLKKETELLELKKRIREKEITDIKTIEKNSNYPTVTWRLLGSLNSDRITARKFNEVHDNFILSSLYPMRKAYPIISWAIENIVVKYSKDSKAEEYIKPIFKAMLSGAELTSRLFLQKSNAFPALSLSNPKNNKEIGIINPGEREKAFEIMKGWFSKEAIDYIKICDPYFGPEELNILKVLNSTDKTLEVKILTSKKHHKQKKFSEPYWEEYEKSWKLISEQSPPETEIFIIGTRSGGRLPLHDRWILTKGGGLNLGTSLNSLGKTQVSKISLLSKEEAESCEKTVDNYFLNLIKKHNDEYLERNSFFL